MKNQKLLIVIFLLISQCVVAQNARFSQIGSAPIQFNPSLTGRFDGKARLSALYSIQETDSGRENISSQLQHQNISFDIKLGKYRSSGDEEIPKATSTDVITGKPVREAKDEISKKRRILGYWGIGLNYYHYGDDKAAIEGSFYSASIARHFYNRRNKFFGFGIQATYADGTINENKGPVADKEISGGTFRVPAPSAVNRISSHNYVDFNGGAYYGLVTDAVMFELGGSMAHLFYPNIDLLNKDDESKLRHRLTAHSVLRVRLNDKWGLVQKNIYWQEGLYYRSKSFRDSLEIISFWTGAEFYKVNPASNINLNFGFYTRSFRTLMPLLNINLGKVANLRYTYEHPINSKKHNAYTATRHEVALILTYKRYTGPGVKFYKKVNFW